MMGRSWCLFIVTLVAINAAKDILTLGQDINQLGVEPQSRYTLKERDANDSIVCMTELEILSCHLSGTDLSRVVPIEEERCRTDETTTQPLRFQQTKRSGISALSTKQCPCKTDYSGLKCETCSDGFYIKFHHHSKSDTRQQTKSSGNHPELINHYDASRSAQQAQKFNFTVRRPSRPFSCKPCNCDPMGSKSYACDKRNGTCFCTDGHTGVKCDECSIGYINIRSNTSQTVKNYLNRSNPSNRRQCIECGDCFNQWHVSIMDLKELSVDVIKRSHELSQSLTSSMGLLDSNYTNNNSEDLYVSPARLVLSGSHDSFDELDEKIEIISERVLANKQNSDRLNLLANELESTINYYNTTRINFISQKNEHMQLATNMTQLEYKLNIQNDLIKELGVLILEKYISEQLNIQETIPMGAYKLIQIQRNRSLNYKFDSTKVKRRFYLDSRNQTLELNLILELLDKNRVLMTNTALDLLHQSLVAHHMNTTLDANFFLRIRQHLLNSAFATDEYQSKSNSVGWKVLSEEIGQAKLLYNDMLAKFKVHLSSFDNRSSEIESVKKLILDSRGCLNDIESNLTRLNLNVTLIQQSLESIFDGPKLADFSQLIENSTAIMRVSLDKVDAKLTLVGSEMTELSKIPINTTTSQLLELSNEINKTLEVNLPFIDSFRNKIGVDLEDVAQLKNETESLTDYLNRMNNELIKAIKIKRDASSTSEQTKALNLKIRELVDGGGGGEGLDKVSNSTTSNTTNSGTKLDDGIKIGALNFATSISGHNLMVAEENNNNNSSNGHQPLNISTQVDLLLDRLSKLQVKSADKQLSTNRLVEIEKGKLEEVNGLNKKLLAELRNSYQEVLFCLLSLEGSKNKTDISSLLPSETTTTTTTNRSIYEDSNENAATTGITTITTNSSTVATVGVSEVASSKTQPSVVVVVNNSSNNSYSGLEPQIIVGGETGYSSLALKLDFTNIGSGGDGSKFSGSVPIDKIRRLDEQRRVANLIDGYQLVTKQLYKSLSKTIGLGDEFTNNERIFTRQKKMLQLLHDEMDEIIKVLSCQ